MDSISELPRLSERVPAKDLPTMPDDLGLSWRPLNRDDAAKLSDLIAVIEEFDQSPFRTSYAETLELFEGDWKNFSTDTIAAVNNAGDLLAYGLLHMPPGDNTLIRVLMDGGVHPTVREVGLGQAVVNWLSARAHNMLRENDSRLPARIAAYLQDNAQHNWQLFETAGFEARRFYRALKRDVKQPVEPVELSPGLHVEPYNASIDDAIRLAHNDAFRDHWGSQPHTQQSWALGRTNFKPEWSFVVIDDNAQPESDPESPPEPNTPLVVGYVMVSKFELDWEVFGYSSGYVELLGVRREYRGRKIALALLTKVIETLREQGIEYAELDVDSENPSGALGMYTHLGFETSSSSRMYSLEF